MVAVRFQNQERDFFIEHNGFSPQIKPSDGKGIPPGVGMGAGWYKAWPSGLRRSNCPRGFLRYDWGAVSGFERQWVVR